MENAKRKEIPSRAYRIFVGIFLCLLSFSLCINAGYCAKGVSFSFSYVLGMASYLLYAFICIEGFFLLIASRGMRIRANRIFWSVILLLIGAIGLITFFAVKQDAQYISFVTNEKEINLVEKLNYVFGHISYGTETGNYFLRQPVSLFFGENEFGCGLFGYCILAIGNSIMLSSTGGLVLSIVFASLGFLLFLVPTIVKACIKSKKKKVAIKNGTLALPNNSQTNTSNNHKRIKNINVVKDAKKIDVKNYHSEVSGAGRNLEDYHEEMIPVDEVKPQNVLKETLFSEETLEEHIKEEDPEIETLDEFRDVVFDFDDLSPKLNSSNSIAEENVEPIIQNLPTAEESIPAPIEVAPAIKPVVETRSEPVKADVEPLKQVFIEAPVQEVPVPKPEPQFVQPQPVQPQPVQPQPAQTQAEQPTPKKPRVNFTVLKSDLLETYETSRAIESNSRIAEERRDIINNTFKDFGIGAEVVDYTIGPSITRFNIRYNPNVSARSVSNLVQDISIRLNGVSARFESIIEGQSTSGLEIPNAEITTVAFKDVYEALPDPKKHPLAVAFGKNIKGTVIYADYDEFPHMLISGTTGSGKSVFVNSIICTLIMRNSPDDLKLVLVDPKKVEMSRYADMPHLLTPIITEPTKVKLVLDKLVDEMEYRYNLFSKNNATNIKEYNEDCEFNNNERMPYIVVILDEYADLVEQCKEISMPVVMLAQKARACGIHIMLSTQRPSTNVVTGVIKANMPTHVALMTANYVDSTTIIGEGGAEKLLGKGDMLVQSPLVSRVGVCRLQSCFINRREIIKIVSELKEKYPTTFDEKYLNLEEQKPSEFAAADVPEGGDNDEETKYQAIKSWVMGQEYMSMSRIQRECGVGFNRAGRFFNRMQKEGIVSTENEGGRGCRVILQDKFGDIDDDDVISTSEDNSYIKR